MAKPLSNPPAVAAVAGEAAKTGARPAVTQSVTRGVRRCFAAMGQATVTELSLKTGRRADIMAVDERGTITIVEVKSSLEDYRADGKWADYGPFCDLFYFAVSAGFPHDILPAEAGLIIADGYEALIAREPAASPLNAARRKAVLLRFARAAAGKLHRLEDPLFGA
jgi:hypothetical protein